MPFRRALAVAILAFSSWSALAAASVRFEPVARPTVHAARPTVVAASPRRVQRVWAVALSGIQNLAPIFCRAHGCGVGSVATDLALPRSSYPLVAFGPTDDLYVADAATGVIRVVGVDGRVSRVIRLPDGVSRFAVAPDGRIAVVRANGDRISEVEPNGRIRQLVGDRSPRLRHNAGCICGDGGPARKAEIGDVNSIVYDPEGRLVIADTLHYRIRRVERSGKIDSIVGSGEPCQVQSSIHDPCPATGASAKSSPIRYPAFLAYSLDGTLWFIHDRYGQSPELMHVRRDGSLRSVAHGNAAGEGVARRFNWLAIGRDGWPITLVTERDSRPRYMRINPRSGALVPLVGARYATCNPSAIALTCGDGLSGISAAPADASGGGISIDSHGGVAFTYLAQEIRYLSPLGSDSPRLGIALLHARFPTYVHRGSGLRFRFVASTADVDITVNIAARSTGRTAKVILLPVSSKGLRTSNLRWNGRIDGALPRRGWYLIQIVGKSAGRVATRQFPIVIQ